MKKHLLWLVLLLALVACKRDKDEPNPDPDLPPATQIGANTFGCYINGQPWTPKGRVGLGTNFYMHYDSGLFGGLLDIGVYRIVDNTREDMTINCSPLTTTDKYFFTKTSTCNVGFTDKNDVFYRGKDADVTVSGELNITRFDLQTGVISGTFHFKLEKQGYPTIEATNGRFDKKL
jgi:Family of unknown function (DUF6252)